MKTATFAIGAGIFAVSVAFGSFASASDASLISFSSDHCSHCRAMEPVLAQLAQTGVPVRQVNVRAEPELAHRYGIRQTPTFVVVTGGRELTRLVGTQSLAELQHALSINPGGPHHHTNAIKSLDGEGPRTTLAPIQNSGGTFNPAQRTAPQTLTSAAPAARGEAMPSLSVADAVQRAEAATVRLRVHDGHGFGVGTGTIIDTHDEEALVLTCGHLFRETEGKGKVEVDLFVGGQTKTVLGQVIDYDADSRDIALVAIKPGFPIQPVALIASDDGVQNGQPAFSFGCDRGDDPSRRDTRITGINKYNQHLGVSNLEIAGAPIDGRSGGGLFDQQGRLVGVCNAADYKGDVGIYAGPGTIRWQLDRMALSELYEATNAAPAPSSPPADRIASLDQNLRIAPANPTGIETPMTNLQTDPTTDSRASGQEVIVIVRDPQAGSRVMTLNNPSPALLQMIQQQARSASFAR